MISHKGFYWQRVLLFTDSSNGKTLQHKPGLSGTGTHLESLLTWQILQLIPHFKYKEILILRK